MPVIRRPAAKNRGHPVGIPRFAAPPDGFSCPAEALTLPPAAIVGATSTDSTARTARPMLPKEPWPHKGRYHGCPNPPQQSPLPASQPPNR